MIDTIAIFDIGKTNKKLLLFNEDLQIVYQEEKQFQPATDDDGDDCDDIEKLEQWIRVKIKELASIGKYNLKAVNFSTYGASLMHLDEKGNRVTPLYDYLKPMPVGIVEPVYEKYGGRKEFLRKTASPALGMLNSGFQILWLKRKKPETFENIRYTLHLPNYLSYFLTHIPASEYTSIGCHTAMWDFDRMQYHQWLTDEGIQTLPDPVPNETTNTITMEGKKIKVGTGIHDSSASLAPYLMQSQEKFILVSTGTWCINMNPFNYEPLTYEQLEQDCLCFMSINQKPVKSSRLFMGRIHDVNVQQLSKHFNKEEDFYKQVQFDANLWSGLSLSERKFFSKGVPEDLVDYNVALSEFKSFESAYHQLMADLTGLAKASIDLVIPENDDIDALYVSGGFARSELFVQMLAKMYPQKKVYTTEMGNATALGAALMVYGAMGRTYHPGINLGISQI